MLIRVGNIEFHGHASSGFLIGPGGFKGWEGSAPTKREGQERVGQHGSHDTPAFKSARLVTLSGYALATSEAELEHMGEVLSGLGQSRQQVVVQSAVGTRWAWGSVDGEVKFDRVGGVPHASFQFSLWMPDPFKYGGTQEFPTSTDAVVSMWHRGNTEAWPKFTITGTFPSGYEIHAGGRVIRIEGSASPVTDTLDTVSGRFTRGGLLATRRVQLGQFWSVPGGASMSWSFQRKGGTGTCTGFLTDTFI